MTKALASSSQEFPPVDVVGRPLRVLHVYRTYFPESQGGLQEAIRQFCRATGRLGVANTVFALAKNPVPAILQSEEARLVRCRSVFEIASCDIGLVTSVYKFRKIAKDADLVHFHYPWPFGDLLGLLAGNAKPFVVTYHSDVVRQRFLDALYGPLRAQFFKRVSRIVTTSPSYRKGSAFLSEVENRVEVIPLCLDAASVPTVDHGRVEYWRARFNQPYFLFVGVLRYYKGLDYLMKAAACSGLPVVIAGDGPEAVRLKATWSHCSNVYFVGHVDDCEKFALIDACRAVVFPSHLRSEAFGMTLLEGAVRKKPLISTEIGTGTSYVNLHEVTGLVVPPADAMALAEAMRCLADNEGMASEMGLAAYRRYELLFSSNAVGTQYVALYNEVLKQCAETRQLAP